MKSLSLFLLLSVILILSPPAAKAMGFGEWAETTNYGTAFRSPGAGSTMILANGDEYQLPRQWYFYRKHIVGFYYDSYSSTQPDRYFVINEVESSYQEFPSRSQWQKYLQAYNLAPLIWTRWHRRQWRNENLLIFLTIFAFPFSLPAIYFGLRQIYRAIRIDNFNLRSKRTLLALILPTLVLLILLLGEFPASI